MTFLPITIIGATGNVGREVVAALIRKKLAAPESLRLTGSSNSVGQTLMIEDHCFVVQKTNRDAFKGSAICLFNTNADLSCEFIPMALEEGAYVVDSSSHYRLDDQAKLIIPPVNLDTISTQQKLYAHANCLASPIATVLHPLDKKWGVRRVNAVTYQSTSGAGKGPMDELWNETKSVIEKTPFTRHYFSRPIAFNILPQVDKILEDGFTYEEFKIIREVQRVVNPAIAITATAVRVPVMIGHSIALSVELEKHYELTELISLLEDSPSVQISKNDYHTPVEVVGKDDVFVGRIRRDPTIENGLHLWLCSDNLRRGAATDAVEIVEALIKKIDN